MTEELAGMSPDDKTITFTRNEWKHFLDEVEMRGIKKVNQCINNARYLAKLDISFEQAKNGQVITFNSFEDFEAATNA